MPLNKRFDSKESTAMAQMIATQATTRSLVSEKRFNIQMLLFPTRGRGRPVIRHYQPMCIVHYDVGRNGDSSENFNYIPPPEARGMLTLLRAASRGRAEQGIGDGGSHRRPKIRIGQREAGV
ncbi:hypothetical protein AZKH_1620 [Azoarcus sp. KH32C]|nr:hypothetical protein AZKH_1620 [Azoarcus sp. KH32C]